MKKRRFGLQAEVVVSIALLMGAALLFSGFLILKIAETQIVDQRVAGAALAMETTGRALAPELATAGDGEFSTLANDSLAYRLPTRLGATAWQVLGRDLRPIVLEDRQGKLKPYQRDVGLARYGDNPLIYVDYSSSLFRVGSPKDSFAVLTIPVKYEGQWVGVVQALFLLDDVALQMEEVRTIAFVYITLYGTILALFGVFLLHRNVIRPIRILMDRTRQVASGNLDQKLPEEGPREISELAIAFNSMTEALELSRQKTKSYIEALEKTNADLQQAKGELILSEKMASVGHLAAGMAHEIGNPLGAIVGYLGLLQGEMSSGKYSEAVNRSMEEAERINRLVRDLLDYAAPGKDAAEWFDPSETVREAGEILKHQGGWGKRQLDLAIPSNLAKVFLPRHKLLQVFVNLLLNARDATTSEGEIRVKGGDTPDSVWISVSDNGTGMSPEVASNIFDPFFTTKVSGKGRGLGLSVSHRIVDEAGGRIEVESAPDRGTTFTVWLKTQG